MANKPYKANFFLWIGVLILVTLGCGSLHIGVVTPTPGADVLAVGDEEKETDYMEISVPEEVNQPEALPGTAEPTSSEDFSHLWVEYRDPAYRYGVALPAHWIIYPTPADATDGAMTTASYDEAYFLAHSTKGWWTDGIIPEGAIKMDFAGMPDEHPELDLASALNEMYKNQSDITVVLSTEAASYNGHEAILMTTASPNNLDETFKSVVFRLANHKILMVTAFWGQAFASPDVQAILNSFAFEGEPVSLPTSAPKPPLTDAPPDNTTRAVAWLGHIYGLPEGGQYDDFVLFSPAGVGEFGINGSTPEIESEIHSLRNKEGIDEYVHLWGQFICGVEDYNHCQLLVDKIHREGSIEENVDGWVGTVTAHTFNGGLSHVFQLVGDVPMWYSLHASQDPTLQAQIESLRDTGAVVKVWGTLMVGIPDVNGLRIEPARLEVLQSGGAQGPLPGANLIKGWQLYENLRFGYRVQYPTGAEVAVHGPDGGIPSDEIPAGMSVEVYQEQLQQVYPELCVEIRIGQGYVNISAPPNAGSRYTPCGITGVGQGEVTSKTEEVSVNGQIYIAQGMEFVGSGDLTDHMEMFSIELENGTRIRFGGGSTSSASYDDYLANTKDVLLQILATYDPLP